MTIDVKQARNFIYDVELPPLPPVAQDGSSEGPAVVFEEVKKQAVVVGSQVMSFVEGVSKDLREALSDSALLAQLVAKQKVPDETKIYDWYDAYFEVLSSVGWVIQDKGFAEYKERDDGFQVHEAILDVAAVLLGPVPGALAIVQATLGGLQKMDEGSKWITLFRRESEHAEAARFQITLVHNDESGSALAEMMAFGISADRTITQVLFFKLKSSRAELRHYSGKLSLNPSALTDLKADINRRVRAFQRNYLAELPDLTL